MKAVVPPVQFITSQAMTGNYTSATQNILERDVASIQLNYTGSPVGSIAVNGSLDGVNFVALYLSVNGITSNAMAIPASTSPIIIDIPGTAIPFIQVVYTFTSGTGTLNGYFSSKRIGD